MKRFLIALATALTFCLVSGCASGIDGRQGDIRFAQMMIPHHNQAIELADMALSKQGVSADVTRLANNVKAGQATEISTFKSWLKTWGAPMSMVGDHNHQAKGGLVSPEKMKELRRLEGTDFAKVWLETMIAHHEGAIQMAEDVLDTTEDPEVKFIAGEITESQRRQIEEMERLRES